MIANVILIVFLLAAVGAGVWSYNDGLRKEGEAKAVAEYERQAKEAEALNARRALEGEAYALKLLEQAEKRVRAQAAKIRELSATRKAIDDERAKVDPEFREWSDGIVPSHATSGLRQRTVTLAAATPSRSVSVASGVAVPADAAGTAAGPAYESPIARVRAWLNRHLGSGVE